MDSTRKPTQDNAADPYSGTPLGVEAAWWHPAAADGAPVLKSLATAIVIALLAACARGPGTAEQPVAASGTSEADNANRPYWQRDPARGEFPYSPRGWW